MRRLLRAAALLGSLACAACGETVNPPPPATPAARDPQWFSELNGSGRQFLFVNELRRYFDARGETAVLDPEGRLEVSGRGPQQVFVVARLAEVAGKLPNEDWPDLIAAHFEAMNALRDAVGDVRIPSWDEARTKLRLRIYPDEFLTGAGLSAEDVVQRVDLPNTRTVLVVDSDDTALVVPRRELVGWGQEFDHVMALAYANTRRALEGNLEVVAREFPEIGSLRVITGDSFYAATAALWLDDFPDTLGAHGAIVAVPWRNGVFVYPFDDARVQRVVPALFRYAQRIVEDSAGPIGTRIWWRRSDGTFAEIAIRELDGQLEIVPPRDLAELLTSLR